MRKNYTNMPHPPVELPFPWSSCHNLLPSLSCWVAKQPKMPNSLRYPCQCEDCEDCEVKVLRVQVPSNIPTKGSHNATNPRHLPVYPLRSPETVETERKIDQSRQIQSRNKVGKTIRQSRTTETCRAHTLQRCTCPPHFQPQPGHGTSARPRRLLQSSSIQFTVGVAKQF